MVWSLCGLCSSSEKFTVTQISSTRLPSAKPSPTSPSPPVIVPNVVPPPIIVKQPEPEPRPKAPAPPVIPDPIPEPSIDNIDADANKNESLSSSDLDNGEKENNNNNENNENRKEIDIIEPDEAISVDVERRAGVIPITATYSKNDLDTIEKHPKDSEDDEIIKKAIEANEFLNKIIKGPLMKEVIDAMYNREIKPKEILIAEGESGNHMYVSAKGEYEVSSKAGLQLKLKGNRVYGEMAILYNEKRNATVKALKPGRVWVLDREVFQKLRLRSNIKEQDEILEFLQKVPQLSIVGERLQKVASLLKVEYFNPGETIVKQGETGDKFYIIRAGTVTITKDNREVGRLEKGKFFGELALLKRDTRQATVTANEMGVECYTLLRQYFLDHIDVENSNFQVIATESEQISEYEDIELKEWKIETTLGIGGFGRVELVKHKTKPNLIFALKYLKKVDMVEQNQQEHVVNERNLQMSCRSKFIVRLYRSYNDSKYVFFLMESCMGGDLWTLLQRQPGKKFDEPNARFIAACILEAFAYLHEREIVYRDLKPENILIDDKGYLKLTDFGFAKKLDKKGRTYTFAGTPEYVAPEILLSKGHDKAVDYWAFGIFIYELLVGRTPFRTNDASHMKTYNKILKGIESVDFPKVVQHKARNIIEKLCKQIPTERLGCQKNGVKDIKDAKWFMGFDWERLHAGKIPSPFKPKLKSSTDTKYFEKFQKDTDIPPDDPTDWAKDF